MITTPLLEEKYNVQKHLSEQAGYDMAEYIEMTQRIIAEVEAKYGFKFKYGVPQPSSDLTNGNGGKP